MTLDIDEFGRRRLLMPGTSLLDRLDRLGGRLYDEAGPILTEPISRIDRMGTRDLDRDLGGFIGSDYGGMDMMRIAPQAPPRERYGLPGHPGAANPALEKKTRGIFSRAYGKIREKLGSYAPSFYSKYVAAVNAFMPSITLIGGMALPKGHASAFYSSGMDVRALDEGTIYNTRKNQVLRSYYKSSLMLAKRIGGHTGEKLRDFYRGIINQLEDKSAAEKNAVHESVHSGLEKEGIADYLSVQQNEGLTCAATDEITGRKSTMSGTTYQGFKKKAYRALYKLGFKGPRAAIRYIKSCMDGKCSGRAFAGAYARA